MKGAAMSSSQALWEPSKDPARDPFPITVNPIKLEHGFRRISARIPYTLP